MFVPDPCRAPCSLTLLFLLPKWVMPWAALLGLPCAETECDANFVN